MPDPVDFVPLFGETVARVRARMDADANAGLVPTDPAYIDTREGSFYWDMTQVVALEIARLWDALGSETVAAAFPSVAWGEYLDEHAATFGLVRNPAVAAVGQVQFGGDAGVLVAQGTRVSATPADPSLDAITFQTTAAGTTGPALPAPTGLGTVEADTTGSLLTGTYIYRVTAYNDFGESLVGADTTAVVGPAITTGKVTVSWSAVAGADGYRVYRTLDALDDAQQIADTATLSFVDLGTVTPGALEPTADTTSGVLINVVALDPGTAGNLAADAITNLDTLVPGITLVTNPAATVDGEDVEDDEALRRRVLAQYNGSAGGTVGWYVQQALAYPGVERAVCIPAWAGAGTVLVIPMLADGTAVSSDVVDGLQAQLDPTPGLGHGTAPVGHTVTVETSTPLTVNVVAVIGFGTGFSLDGTSGTIPSRAAIVDAIAGYLATLGPGDTISYQKLEAVIFTVEGVASVTGLTVNSGTADIPLTIPDSPILATPTLS